MNFYNFTTWTRKMQTNFSKVIIHRLRENWNRRVKRIQMPLKKGHLKLTWQNVKRRFDKTG